MWPWEHALLAYVFYSLFSRLRSGDPPSGDATLVLVCSSVLPDLLDKTLAWQFGVLQSGYGPAHSLVVAIPLGAVLLVATRQFDRPDVGWGFAFGHLLHIAGDVVPASLARGTVHYSHVLWPVVVQDPFRQHQGLADGLVFHLADYVQQILALELSAALVLQLIAVVLGGTLWIVDGRPGLATTGRVASSVVAWSSRSLGRLVRLAFLR